MEKRRLLIIGNTVTEDWEFKKGVEAATGQKWDVQVNVINRFDGLRKFTRYLTFLFTPLRLFFIRNRYEKIVYWEQFLGLVLVFYCRLFHVKKYPDITIMALIYKPKKGLIGRVFAWFVNYTVTSKYVKQIIVYSQSEVDYYADLFHIPKEKFRTEMLGIEDKRGRLTGTSPLPQGKYCVSAGRSNRDYDFLRQAWPDEAGDIYVVCDVEKSEDTEHIKYKKDCHGDEYLRLLSGAHVSFIPLVSEKFSSGQLVFLQSAMLGVPVIVTKNNTVMDYVDQGKTGLIIDKTPEALREALKKLDDPACYKAMSQNARKAFEERFSQFELGKRVGANLP